MAEPDDSSNIAIHEELSEVFEELHELGNGSQGKVTLWRKRSNTDRTKKARNKHDDGSTAKDLDSQYDSLPSLIAVKTSQFSSASDRKTRFKTRARVYDHIRAQRGFFHENIVKHLTLIAFDNGSVRYIRTTMGFYNGGTVDCLLKAWRERKKPIPEAFMWHVFKQVAAALKCLHSMEPPIVHRDVKPQNLMLHLDPAEKEPGRFEFPTVVLGDFDLSGLYQPENCSYSWGTVLYTAPESRSKAEGHRSTPKSDVFSLGAVIQTLAGRAPPGRLNPDRSGKENLHAQYGIDAPETGVVREIYSLGYSLQLDSWMKAALQKNDKARPTSHELVRDMFRVADLMIAHLGGAFEVLRPIDMEGPIVHPKARYSVPID